MSIETNDQNSADHVDGSDHVDGCDCPFDPADETLDEDLPVATGGGA